MTSAYAVIANGGLRVPPTAIRKVESASGSFSCDYLAFAQPQQRSTASLQPTPDTKASARNPDGTPKRTANGEKLDEFSPGLEPNDFNNRNGVTPKKISYPTPIEESPVDQGRMTETTVPAREAVHHLVDIVRGREAAPKRPSLSAPSVVRVSQWVARTPRTPLPSTPQSVSKPSSISLAGNVP